MRTSIFNRYDQLTVIFFSRQIHGNLGSSVAVGSEIIEPEEWHHLVYRYDAQSK